MSTETYDFQKTIMPQKTAVKSIIFISRVYYAMKVLNVPSMNPHLKIVLKSILHNIEKGMPGAARIIAGNNNDNKRKASALSATMKGSEGEEPLDSPEESPPQKKKGPKLVGGDRRDRLESSWRKKYDLLVAFCEANDGKFPTMKTNPKLSTWLTNQKAYYRKEPNSHMFASRVPLFEKVGFDITAGTDGRALQWANGGAVAIAGADGGAYVKKKLGRPRKDWASPSDSRQPVRMNRTSLKAPPEESQGDDDSMDRKPPARASKLAAQSHMKSPPAERGGSLGLKVAAAARMPRRSATMPVSTIRIPTSAVTPSPTNHATVPSPYSTNGGSDGHVFESLVRQTMLAEAKSLREQADRLESLAQNGLREFLQNNRQDMDAAKQRAMAELHKVVESCLWKE